LSRQRRISLAGRLVVVLVVVAFAVFPILWIISASFNPSSSMATQQFIPANASTSNYDDLLHDPLHPFARWLGNSVRVASLTSFLVVLVTAFSAYSFSRFRFRGRRGLLLSILLIQVFPNMLAMVALFLLLQQLGAYVPWLGLNSHGGLILVYLGTQMGINIWLMKGFFDSIPRDIDESALVDGASHWQAFWRLIVPLVRPVLAVVAILSFVSTFNEFVLANVLLRSTEQFTLMAGLYLFVTQNFAQSWGVFAAGALVGALPIVALYLLLQDQIIGGLTQGAVKG
jgi:ABC-type maltose transport system permease subunit